MKKYDNQTHNGAICRCIGKWPSKDDPEKDGKCRKIDVSNQVGRGRDDYCIRMKARHLSHILRTKQ